MTVTPSDLAKQVSISLGRVVIHLSLLPMEMLLVSRENELNFNFDRLFLRKVI